MMMVPYNDDGSTVRAVTIQQSFGYVDEIYQVMVKEIDSKQNKAATGLEALASPPMKRMMDRQDREEALQRHIARKEKVTEEAPSTNPVEVVDAVEPNETKKPRQPRIKASMKKNLYKVTVKLSSESGNVCAAASSCPAGIGLGAFGHSNHVGGILFALEDFNRCGLQEFPSPVSCTSRLSAWNVPNFSSLAFFAAAPIEDDATIGIQIAF
ncbi:uncharacterized protein LOC135687729 [Rhopilema esculentum]|uniref:uncharacterized protein LOC135687729 n=1 Tax=Rhopilema esculentum TaxID=499914 RepID=UPI0031D2FA5E